MSSQNVRQQAAEKWAQRRAEQAMARGEDDGSSPVGFQRDGRRKRTNPSPSNNPWASPYAGMPHPAMGYMGGMGGFFPPMNPFMMDPAMMRNMYSAMPPSMMPMPGYGGAPMGGPGGRPSGKGGKGKGKGGGDSGKGGKKSRPMQRAQDERSPKGEEEELDPNMCELLKTFRADGQALTLTDVTPFILEFAKDSKGSNEFIRLLDEAGRADKAAPIEALTPEVKTLSLDANGSLVVGKLFESAGGDQRKALVAELRGEFLKLTMDANGCRVVQRAIEHISKESQLIVAAELKEHVSDCIHSMHGNHVIQKCIEQMPPDTVQFILEATEKDIDSLVVHRYGCRIVQRLLEHCAREKLEGMMGKICEGCAKFAKDPYGNYVVQHMLQHGRKDDKKRIIAIIKGNILDFAQHKCSSNVVDKCFEVATMGEHAGALDEERAALTRAVLGGDGDPNPPIKSMMHDRFGSHIVQHMLEHSRGPEREELITRLKMEEGRLRTSTAGRRLVNSLSAA